MGLTSRFFAALLLLKNDINLFRNIIDKDAKETQKIFQSQVAQMRTIRDDIERVKTRLHDIHTDSLSKEIEELEHSINLSEDILSRTDGVIESLQGFVTILQSQDRLEQMLQGSQNVIGELLKDEQNIETDSLKTHKEKFAKHYTIKEQREFAEGRGSRGTLNKITIF